MILVITEKPDTARKFAAVIGASQNKREWLEGSGYCVTWMFGHLLELYTPEAEGRWKDATLPILPREFKLAPIPLRMRDGQRDRIDVIRDLIKSADSLIEATDAGREGELIFRNIYDYIGIRKPFKRLWINSLTEESIAEGFKNLLDGHEKDGLAKAAKQREIADWLVGINATRAFTRVLGCEDEKSVMSLGRVQTPTLCIICDRWLEHTRFQPEPFWYIRGQSIKDGQTVSWRETSRHTDKAEAESLYDRILSDGTITVKDIATERKTEEPPLLFNLAELQKAANTKYNYGIDMTLECAQSLYEKQLTTYPRTDSRYIPEDVFRTIPDLLRKVSRHPRFGAFAQDLLNSGTLCRRSVDDTKISDHHALLVTGRKPEGLSETEEKVYDLILSRMLESLSKVCVADVTKVTFIASGADFEARARKDVSLGWRAILRTGDYDDVALDDVDDVAITMRPLPPLTKGEVLGIAGTEIVEDTTKPKPLLTESTLLTMLEDAGNRSDSKDVADALRGKGIGTSATRAAILSNLIDQRHFVEKTFIKGSNGKKGKKPYLVPTKLGVSVYAAIRDRSIAQVDLTARWEIALSEIESGERDDRHPGSPSAC